MSTKEENALRYRRAQSVTKAEEITEKEKKARNSQLDKPYVNSFYKMYYNHVWSIIKWNKCFIGLFCTFFLCYCNTLLRNNYCITVFFFSIHKPRDSLFSWSSEFTNFTGLVNWGFLLLTIGGVRLCLENFLK